MSQKNSIYVLIKFLKLYLRMIAIENLEMQGNAFILNDTIIYCSIMCIFSHIFDVFFLHQWQPFHDWSLKFKLNMLRYFDFHQTWNHNRETSNAMVYSLHVVGLFSRKTIIQEISVDKPLIWHEKYQSKQTSILDWKPSDVQFIEVLVCYMCMYNFLFIFKWVFWENLKNIIVGANINWQIWWITWKINLFDW